MEKLSVWRSEADLTSFPALYGEIQADVVILGGGITGITAAYLLSKAGKSVALLEARKTGLGSTGFSTGNLYAPIGGEGLNKIASNFDNEKLRAVVASRAAAVDLIEQVVRTNQIDCDFKRVPWCLFTVDGSMQSFILNEREAAAEAGLPIVSSVPYPHAVEDGFSITGQAQFNPLKYVTSLASITQSVNCRIFENTHAVKIEEGEQCTVETENGKVTASKIIMATHTPKGLYAVHTVLGPYREYAVAAMLRGSSPGSGIFWEMQESEHYSIRTYDTTAGPVIIALGETHKVGQQEENLECYNKLEEFLRKRFDVASVLYKWSAQQYKSADTLPYIGTSFAESKTYIATGFAADGLTYGTLAAMIITDEILGNHNKWSKTYDASRITPLASAKKFVKENVNVAYELVKDWLSKDVEKFSDVRPYSGKIMEIEGTKHGVHRDGDGNLHVVSAVCPHMGCIVHWNTAEQTWDCPCHGSRFTTDGEVIEGPAINPLRKIGG
ncbi:MAG TPA: FAD-dependent oxidoreductase [Sphingobacteriaceae bacterium]